MHLFIPEPKVILTTNLKFSQKGKNLNKKKEDRINKKQKNQIL